MSKKSLYLSLFLLMLVAGNAQAFEQWVHYFPAADNTQQQGFLRISNTSDTDTVITITGVDDAGVTSASEMMFPLNAGTSLHFNSQDLEAGNLSKGLNGSLADGTGSWRLKFTTDVEIALMALFRNDTGFVNNIHDTAFTTDNRQHQVHFFNPGSNVAQVSRLRLVNTADEPNTFQIIGWDDNGEAGDAIVYVEVDANASVELSALDLETGSDVTENALGDGAGKWRFIVYSSRDSQVISLLEDPGGNLSNLSLTTPPEADGSYVLNYILPADAPEQSFLRFTNANDTATDVTITGIDDSGNPSASDITFTLAAHDALNFNSTDFEQGNANKGLNGALGDGDGFWRLIVTATQDVGVMGLFRTNAGFVNSLHDKPAPEPATSHTVSFFNPGFNIAQVSVLRVNNLTDGNNEFTVTGIDDNGNTIGSAVTINTGPMESVEMSSAELEAAGMGDGSGKWRLAVTSTALAAVQSLLRAPNDFQSNLSTWVDVSDRRTGIFIDSPVSGLAYTASPSGLSGTTTGGGEFTYEPGDTLTFSVGALEFPAVAAGPILSPLDMNGSPDTDANVTRNVTLILQILDDDNDPDNGVTIPAGAADLTNQVNFNLETPIFAQSVNVTNMLAALGEELVLEDAILDHLELELLGANVPFISSGFDDLEGVWTNGGATFLFLPDDEFFAVLSSSPTQGFERGTWVRFGRHAFAVQVEQNHDGNVLLCRRDDTSMCPRIRPAYDITGNTQLQISTFTYGRALTSGSSLAGVWSVPGEDVRISFLDDGTYLAIQYIEVNNQVGFEKGTYTVAGTNVSVDIDTNNDGDALLCNEPANTTCSGVSFSHSVAGDTLTIDFGGGDAFDLNRIL